MSDRSPLPDRARRFRLDAGQRVAILGALAVIAIGLASWIGFRDTDELTTGLDALSTATADLATLRQARISLETANHEFDSGVAVGGVDGLRSISAALTHFDEGSRSWEEFTSNVAPYDETDAATRARIDDRLAKIRSDGEVTAALVLSADRDSTEWARLAATRAEQNQALREDFDLVEQIQGTRLVDDVDDLSTTVDETHRAVMFGGAAAMLVVALGTALFAVRASRREREQGQLAAEREQISRRNALDAKLQAALDMAETEDQVVSVVRRALTEAVPHRLGELLLAEAPSAELTRVIATNPDEPGCLVPTPDRCPAARHGQRLVFETPFALNACFYLQDRPSGPCSAVCAPVNVAGRAVGVVHVTAPENRPPGEHEIASLDVIARKASERLGTMRAFGSMTIQARTDPLTGLLNRRSIDAALEGIERLQGAYVVAFADLDRFKQLNDTHGHAMGDKALELFSHVMRSSVRPGDLVGRYGGEEFVLVFPDCDIPVAVRILERVQTNLAVALAASTVPPFTSSFGVSAGGGTLPFRTVIEVADSALLRAKAAGRNRIEVDVELETGSERVPDASPSDPATA